MSVSGTINGLIPRASTDDHDPDHDRSPDRHRPGRGTAPVGGTITIAGLYYRSPARGQSGDADGEQPGRRHRGADGAGPDGLPAAPAAAPAAAAAAPTTSAATPAASAGAAATPAPPAAAWYAGRPWCPIYGRASHPRGPIAWCCWLAVSPRWARRSSGAAGAARTSPRATDANRERRGGSHRPAFLWLTDPENSGCVMPRVCCGRVSCQARGKRAWYRSPLLAHPFSQRRMGELDPGRST